MFVFRNNKNFCNKKCCFEIQYLSQQFKSTELDRARKPCTSRRERKSLPSVVTGKPAPRPRFNMYFPCYRGAAFKGLAALLSSTIAGKDVPWKVYFALNFSCDSLPTNQHFLTVVAYNCSSCIIQ